MNFPKFLTTVTNFSRIFTAVLFISLPFAGFYLGIQYQQTLSQAKEPKLINNTQINYLTPTPADETPTPESAEGKFCGGFAANLPKNQCPTGYRCQLDGKYPDAGGKCVKQ